MTDTVIAGVNGMPPATWTNTNGTQFAPEPAGPRLTRREVWFDLPDEYAGFRAKVWVNYPRRLNDDLATGDSGKIVAVLRQIVLEHNDWRDYDGAPFPPASTAEFWAAIPDELAAAVIILLREQVGKLAASLQARNPR